MIHRCPQIYDLLAGVLELYEDGVLYESLGNLWGVLYLGHEPGEGPHSWEGGGDDGVSG